LRTTSWKWLNRSAVRSLPDHIYLKEGSSSLWVSRNLEGEPKLDLLVNPDLLFSHPQCEIIKDQRKIKVGRVPLEIGGKVKEIYLKRYNAFSWRYRIGSLFIPSGAFRSLVGATILTQGGFLTGESLAAVEHRSWGTLTKSFYLSAEVKGGMTADVYWRERLAPLKGKEGFYRRRNFLKMLALLFRSLHAQNIYHNDLKDANILVAQSDSDAESFYLLDLEGVRRYAHLVERRRIKNLVQLNRTMGRVLRGSERFYFLKEYLTERSFSRQEGRHWIKWILKKSQRADWYSLVKNLQGAG